MPVRIANIIIASNDPTLTDGTEATVLDTGYRGKQFMVEGWINITNVGSSGASITITEGVCFDINGTDVCGTYNKYTYTATEITEDGGIIHIHTKLFTADMKYFVKVLESGAGDQINVRFIIQELETV